ncbi:MAG TPA: hypothetical protein VNJ28_07990, partial [Candidatus Limnocylindrales bacterium]|nr:hypothetical protein [Candidatus Limnocylindrales bacterium]
IAALPALSVVWVVLLGLGLGAVFPLVLTLPVDVAERAEEVGGLAAIMLAGGYGLSSIGPVALGLIRDASGSFEASLWLLVGIGALLVAAAWLLVPAGLGHRRATGA